MQSDVAFASTARPERDLSKDRCIKLVFNVGREMRTSHQ